MIGYCFGQVKSMTKIMGNISKYRWIIFNNNKFLKGTMSKQYAALALLLFFGYVLGHAELLSTIVVFISNHGPEEMTKSCVSIGDTFCCFKEDDGICDEIVT